MDDIASLTGQPRPVTAGDETRMVYPLDADMIGKLQAWVDRQFPDPFAIADAAIRSGRYNATQQQFLLRTAMEQATKRHPIGTPEADALLYSAAGVRQLLYVTIAKGDPSFTEADADRFAGKLTAVGEAAAQFHTGLGMVTGGDDGDDDDPKATAPAA